MMGQANLALGQGRFSECEALTDRILVELPDHPAVLVLRGLAGFRQGKFDDSASFFRRAVAVDPNSAAACHWLSMALSASGHAEDALVNARKAASLNPGDLVARHQIAVCLIQLGQFEQALTVLRPLLTQAPNVAVVHYSTGLALKGLRQVEEAIRELKRAVKIDSAHVGSLTSLRDLQYEGGMLEEAEVSARLLSRLEPESSASQLWLGRILMERGLTAAAEAELTVVLARDPKNYEAALLMGMVHQMQGRIDAADVCFYGSIEANPKQGAAYLALASNRRMNEEQQGIVDRMLQLVSDEDLGSGDRMQLHYALGKANEDLGDYREAMAQFDEANRLAAAAMEKGFDRNHAAAHVDRIISAYTRDRLAETSSIGLTSTQPIFVVGMIRSGTTLTEQILSSHSMIGGAGELDFWLKNANVFLGGTSRLDLGSLRVFAEKYLRLQSQTAPGFPRVVDKMPMNYEALGLLHLAYPNAKIVHVRRNPVDTCLSIYTTPNRARLAWAHDRSDIVFQYRLYERLMEHWRQSLPEGVMLDVEYEEVVSHLEDEARRMVSYCGLTWEDACLKPQNNTRSVATPSVWQVRQPVYRTSVARWRRYEGLLGAFNNLLANK